MRAGGTASRAAFLALGATDPIARLLADERSATAAAAHRSGGHYAWRSSLPPLALSARGGGGDPRMAKAGGGPLSRGPTTPQQHHAAASFVLHLNAELVAAAAFPGCEAGDGVFVAWEVVLPVGQGWSVLATRGGGGGGEDGGGRWLAASDAAVIDTEDPWVTAPNARAGAALDDSSSGSSTGSRSRSSSGSSSGSGDGYGVGGGGKVDDTTGLLQQQQPGLRRRRGGRRDAGVASSVAAAAPASRRPPAPPRARALVIPSLSGVTQVGRFAERPWTFGRAAAAAAAGPRGRSTGGVAGAHNPADAAFPGLQSSSRHPSAAAATAPLHRFSGATAARTASTVGGLHDAAALEDVAEKAEAGTFDEGGAESLRTGSGDFVTVREVEARGGDGCRGGPRESLCTRLCCIVGRGAPFEPRTTVAHLSCPLTPLALFFDARVAEAAGRAVGADAPQLYLAAFSRDSWGRTRAEGYGYVDLPVAAGMADVLVRTWAPIEGVAARERDFFLGGGGRLVDAMAAGIPAGLVAAGQPRESAATGPPPELPPAPQAPGVYPDGAPRAESAPTPPSYNAAASIAESVRLAAASVGVNRYGWGTRGSGEIGVRIHAIRENAPAAPPAVSSASQVAAAAARAQTISEIIAEARALRDRDRANASAVFSDGRR